MRGLRGLGIQGLANPVFGAGCPGGLTYYVDFTGGSDANSGQTLDSAWKTITKVNATTFFPGDRILFKRGETWAIGAAAALTPPADNLTFGAYGTGSKPIINGQDAVNCVYMNGRNNIRFDNLNVIQGLDSCFQIYASNYVHIVDCDTEGAGNDNIVFISGCNHCSVYGGIHATPYSRLADGRLVTCIEIADGGSDFLIESLTLTGSAGAGISIHNHSAADPQGATDIPTDVVIRNVIATLCTTNGIMVLCQGATASHNITISNCTASVSDTGIRIYKSLGSAVYPTGVVISDCLMHTNTAYGFYVEGDGITLKRCRIYGTAQQNRVYNSKNLHFYNNTVWLQPASAIFPWYALGNRCENLTVKNNIIHADNTSGYVIGFAENTGIGADVNYNVYYFPNATSARWMWLGTGYTYANWKTNSSMDANSPASNTVDPAFTSEPTDLTLQAGSPAIDAGVVIAGVTDGYLGVAPDCGAYEKA